MARKQRSLKNVGGDLKNAEIVYIIEMNMLEKFW